MNSSKLPKTAKNRRMAKNTAMAEIYVSNANQQMKLTRSDDNSKNIY